jgi:Protein of unknown function (DUF2516)
MPAASGLLAQCRGGRHKLAGMAVAAPIFFDDVTWYINLALFFFTLVIEGVAFVHCLTQRSDAFPAIGTLPKGAWLGIIGITLLLTVLFLRPGINLFGLIGITAAAIYLLDVRIGLRDVADGHGPW